MRFTSRFRRHITTAALSATVALCLATPGAAQKPTMINDRPILNLIGGIEAPAGYDDYYRGIKIKPQKPVSRMTIREVIDFQNRAVAHGSKSSAIGRYQFIRGTLSELTKKKRIHPDTIFDKRVQDFLARMMLKDCDYYTRDVGEVAISNCLAKVWASLPVITGPKAGRSYYHGVAGNRSLIGIGTVVRTVALRFQDPNAIVISMR
jgi:hypothetical protein